MAEWEERQIDLGKIFRLFFRRLPLILGISSGVSLLVGGVVSFLPPTYESYSLLKIGRSGNQSLESEQQTLIVFKTIPQLKDIAQRINYPQNEDKLLNLSKRFRFTSKGGDLLEVRADGSSPEEAQHLVKVITDSIMERHTALYSKAKQSTEDSLQRMQAQLHSSQLIMNFEGFFLEPSNVEVSPMALNRPVRPKRAKIIAYSFGITLLIMLLAVLLKPEPSKI